LLLLALFYGTTLSQNIACSKEAELAIIDSIETNVWKQCDESEDAIKYAIKN